MRKKGSSRRPAGFDPGAAWADLRLAERRLFRAALAVRRSTGRQRQRHCIRLKVHTRMGKELLEILMPKIVAASSRANR